MKGDSWDSAATKKLTELVMDQLGTVTLPATEGIVLGEYSGSTVVVISRPLLRDLRVLARGLDMCDIWALAIEKLSKL